MLLFIGECEQGQQKRESPVGVNRIIFVCVNDLIHRGDVGSIRDLDFDLTTTNPKWNPRTQ
jgi:hypothetical protein